MISPARVHQDGRGPGDTRARLAARNISVSFGGVRALTAVTCVLPPATLTAVVGPNGAGKTTLFNVLGGFVAPDEGSIMLDGIEIQSEVAASRARRGITRLFQDSHLFSGATVLENVSLATPQFREVGIGASLGGIRIPQAAIASARDVLAALGIQILSNRPATGLSFGEQRLVALARAIASQPRVLLVDEISAGVHEDLRLELLKHIRRCAEAGTAVALIEHDIELARQTADFALYLVSGHVSGYGPAHQILTDLQYDG